MLQGQTTAFPSEAAMTANTTPNPPTITVHHELVDWIIDFLHDDIKTLRACSLVSHVWLPASSFHLLSRLRWPPCGLHQWSDADMIFTPCKCHLVGNSETLGDLTSLLSGSPRIASHVRELRVGRSQRLDGDGSFDLLPRTTSPSEIAHILQLAPRVAVLRLSHLALRPDAVPPAESARSLRHLELTMPVSQSITCPALLAFLSHFREISTFDLLTVYQPPTDVPAALEQPARRVPVSTLRIFFLEPHAGGSWLVPLGAWLDITALTALTVHDVAFGPMATDPMSPALHRLLRDCTSLRALTCIDNVFCGLLTYPEPCPTLRELRFDTEYVLSGSSPSQKVFAVWGTFMDLLRCPLTAAVQDVACNLTFIWQVGIFEGVPAGDALARKLEGLLEALDWSALAVAAERLRSFTLNVQLFLTTDSIFNLKRNAQRARKATREVYRGIIEQRNRAILNDAIEGVVKGKMGAHPAQRLIQVDVYFP